MSESMLEKQAPDELAGLRLDQALAKMFPQYSRSRLKSWVLEGGITVDGDRWKPRDIVSGGERIQVRVSDAPEVRSVPEPIDLDVAYEDSALIVINKPAGLVVHPGAGNATGTLMNGLMHRFPELANLPRAGIVHRLDKETTGLLIVARTLVAHTDLVRQLAERTISRRYDAICLGVLTGGGTIDAPIRRHPVDRKRMAVDPAGKPAVSHYTVARMGRRDGWRPVRPARAGRATADRRAIRCTYLGKGFPGDRSDTPDPRPFCMETPAAGRRPGVRRAAVASGGRDR